MSDHHRHNDPAGRRARRLADERSLGRAGLLAALAPLLVPALLEMRALGARTAGYDALPGLLPIAFFIAGAALDGSLMLARRPTLGRTLIVAAALAFAVLGGFSLRHSPAQAMALLLATLMVTAWTYFAPEAAEPGHTLKNSRLARARSGALGCVIGLFALVGFRLTHQPHAIAYAITSVAVVLLLVTRAVGRLPGAGRKPTWRDALVVGATLASVGAALLLSALPDLAALALTPAPLSMLFVLRPRIVRDPLHVVTWRELLLEQPARLLVGTFLLAGLAGGVILSLPPCATGSRVLLLDALFTAFSAVCVTGLAVLDTAKDFSFVGQGVILVLNQLGGLGIMSFSTAAMVLLGQRLSLREEGAALELLGGDRRSGLDKALRRMLWVTFVSEGIGALLLALLFAFEGDGPAMALWRGLFTAISAYCNAGFAIQSDSLMGYQHAPAILHVTALLIIVGGLGPAVVVAIPGLARRRRLNLHARIVLVTNLVLLLVPACLIAALEWHHSLEALSLGDRLHNAWFQAVTTRTAGFNSVDFAAMTPASQTLVEALMFIGGSPGSTAGGIKTTTVFVLIFAVVAVTRSRPAVIWGGWTIPHATIYRAAAVVTLGALSVAFALFTMQLTQAMDTPVALFEVVSALGTVGLSIGGTALLDSVGKLIIIVCMFMGRVAPLTLFLIFNKPTAADGTWDYPEQDVSVG
ncbi:MAG: hypothetical protein KC431_10090 [Myxococcales bacterium]|nr:hypothetical protein [Myxococcales bacterium]